MSTHIIYHQVKPGVDCPDGIMAAAVAYGYHRGIGEAVTVAGACYRKDYPPIPDIEIPAGTRKLVIVDFSYPADWILFWELQENLIVTIFEHHADKFGWLQDFSGAILDEKECGATLAWKYYYPDREMPAILAHVRRRDIGEDGYYSGEVPESEAINLGLRILRSKLSNEPIEEALRRLSIVIMRNDFDELLDFRDAGGPQIEERDRLIASRLPKSSLYEIDGISCAYYDFTNDPEIAPHYSMLGHRIAKHQGVNLAWMVDGTSNHLRSLTPDVNCSTIAKSRGGGGHPCASGWKA
jgi:uncharacterized protein